ncbi:hypothetical protein ROD_19131 [Citrobacter rodentium ICC168]|uniref:Uncharacterized protein n=1 Tax=Citrobacter rodentium (strain ICC168) TaxID=637910 RepID=D2TMV8_CITRI|nr:hypothetical protein ROD_19131 [Citrobacter rodentium ICC168]
MESIFVILVESPQLSVARHLNCGKREKLMKKNGRMKVH